MYANEKMFCSSGLTILAVKELAHRAPASLIRFSHSLAFIGVHAALRCGVITWFGSTALWARVGETGLIRLQLKLLPAEGADFNRKNHSVL